MEISSINNSPNFGARIIIQKTGFKNLGADLVDSFKIGSSSAGLGTSASTETTILPSDYEKGLPFSKIMTDCINKMKELLDGIFHRNIKTSEIEGINVKEVASNSAVSTAGAGTISTGLGSYDLALGSALDQSANRYADSVYNASIPGMLEQHLPASAWKHLDNMEYSAYNFLYNEHGIGNETASCASTTVSGLGATVQGFGFKLLTKGKNAFKTAEEAQRKLPS